MAVKKRQKAVGMALLRAESIPHLQK